MIPNGTPYINYPPFANNGSKTPPGGSTESAKYALGMIPSDTFPAEWANYLFHGATEGVTRLNADAGSMKKEINNVLSEASITPDALVNTQLFTAIKALANLTRTIISLTTSASERPAKSDVPFIPSVQDGLRISVKFTNGYYDAATNGFTFNLNNQGAKKIYVAKAGALTEMQYHEVTRDGVQRKWYVQPFTILDLIYDATLDSGVGAWIVEGNPVILSSSDYVIYADGFYKWNRFSTTQERWTGKFWTDGKPIYCKIVELFNIPVSLSGDNAAIPNFAGSGVINKIIKIDGAFNTNDDSQGMIGANTSADFVLFADYIKSNDTFYLEHKNGSVINDVSCNIEYTKTSDSAGIIPPFSN